MDISKKEKSAPAYLTALGAWALAFGCSVGWGSFIMPGTTFLPVAGPVGSAVGLGLGAAVMLVIAANYHFLMNRCPEMGGTYAYTRRSFGYDHGFLAAWFVGLTYCAIIWANASALPLIFRTLFGDALQFGFHYVIAGYHVYMGEVLLAVLALVLAAAVCLRRSLAMKTQIVLAAVLLLGIIICFAGALAGGNAAHPFQPACSPDYTPLSGIVIVFALAPWAYVGFESICHSSEEAAFPLKKSFRVMAVALLTGGIAYMLLSLLAVTSLPEGCGSWTEYITNLSSYQGAASQPAFFAANTALGGAGSAILGVAALCAVLTGLIGNFIGLSRLLCSLANDGMLPGSLGKLDKNHAPRSAILVILIISVIFPFLGRTAISWIVDVTTVGATITYAIVSAAAWKTARLEKNRRYVAIGVAGVIISILFALEFLIPNITAVKTLSTESYLILAVWSILGFLVLRMLIIEDREKRLGRSTFALVILLSLTIFTSSVWMLQAASTAVEEYAEPIQEQYLESAELDGDEGTAASTYEYLVNGRRSIDKSMTRDIVIQVGMIVIALVVMIDIMSITQRRERQAEIERAIAEEASHAKTSFLSNMSHEIRTPMNAIIGLDILALRNPNLQPQTREQLEKIGASARHLLGLINDVLDMSRIESGRMILKNEEFSLREFLDQVNIMINGQCAEKGLTYECSVIGQVNDYYYGDDMKLKQVLINILGNAVKFTDAPGSILLTVEQVEENEDTCTMRFVSRDTGIGMDPEFIPHIFEAFSQEDMSNTVRYGGSGLGLSITKNLVEMMNGSIVVESEKGVGSVFTVTVVLNRSGRSFEPGSGVIIPANMRAAVVDDDPVSCEHAQMVLKSLGIEADCFLDPWEAIGVIRDAFEAKTPYGLVITDFKMPNMNGLELTHMIREFDENKTAVIMLTGYNWDIIEDEANEGGVDSIGAKPLFADSLLHEINSILRKKSGAAATADEAEEEKGRSVLAGRRILMAEDVAQNAEILQDLLELEDMIPEHAENGKLATEMFAGNPPYYYDAILMDVRMPIMDGLTAAETIRAMDRPDAKTIPIIALTANVFDEDVKRSMEAGMNAHLAKPIEPDLMYATLEKYLDRTDG